jgi:AAA family ATP:ADP antiporter
MDPPRPRLTDVRAGEVVSAALSFACHFSLLSANYVVRPIREALGVEGGIENYPWLFTGTLVSTLAIYPLLGALASRTTRTRFAAGVFAVIAASLIGFSLLLRSDLPEVRVGQAFFVWVSVFNLILTSVFWGVMADVFSNEQGRRLFGVIAAGGTAGAMVGPFTTRLLVSRLGVEGLLLLAAGLIAAALACVIGLARVAPRSGGAAPREPEPVIGGAVFDGLSHVARSPYLRAISLYILFLTATATFVYFQQGWIVNRELAGRAERTEFFATLDTVTNVLTLVVQLFLTRAIARRLGVTALLVALPLVSAAGLGLLAAAPALLAVGLFQAVRRMSDYGLARPGREILFTVVSREDKFKAKNVVDVVVYRGGDAATAWLNTGLKAAGLGIGAVGLAALPLCALWAFTARALGRMEERRRAAPPAGARP